MRAWPVGRVWALALTVAFGGIYTLSASRTVILDNLDAAEFQTVGAVGGILHQPYPLWCTIARVFALFPAFEPAFRVTLVSIVFASMCVGLLFLLLFRRTQNTGAAAGGAIAFGLSFTFWKFSAVAEIYALVTFLFIASLYLIDRLTREESEGTTLLLALTLGFLLSQQSLNIAAVPGLIVLIIVAPRVRRQLFATRGLALRIVVFVLPFSLYLFTFFVDRGPYPMNWIDLYGAYVAQSQGIDASQLQSFFGRMGFQMWIGRLNPEMPSFAEFIRSGYFWMRYFFSVEFPFVAPVLVAVGLIAGLRRNARYVFFLLALVAPYLALAVISWAEMYPYSIPFYVVAVLFLADGILVAARWTGKSRRLAPMVIAVLVTAMPLLRHAKASPVSTFLRSEEARATIASSEHFFIHLEARNDRGRKYGEKVAAVAEPGSLVFGGWREANVLFYHKYVIGHLEQVRVSHILPNWDQVAAVIDSLQPTAVYFTRIPVSETWQFHNWLSVTESYDIFPDHTLHRVRLKSGHSTVQEARPEG
jgi:hypothetical protein